MTPATPRFDWDIQSLRAGLVGLLPGIEVEVAASLPSTNSELIERLRLGLPSTASSGVVRRSSVESRAFNRRASDVEPVLLVAEHQTAGRGRQGRSWESRPGASLTFSLALPYEPVEWSGLSLAVGVAVADALDPPDAAHDVRIGLKWPNDLWLLDAGGQGRKLGGVLIETVTAGARRIAVIGVGLNVEAIDVPDASTGVASLVELHAEASAPRTLARIAVPLAKALRQFERSGFEAFVTRFAARDVLAGRPVTTTHAEAPQGIAHGVDAEGALQVETASGPCAIRSGEVSVRPASTSDLRAC